MLILVLNSYESIYIFSEGLFLCRYSLFKIVQSITPNIIMYLPKNVDLAQLEEMAFLSSPPLTLEVMPYLLKHRAEHNLWFQRHYKKTGGF